MTRFFAAILLVVMNMVCYGQGTDPYKGKPYKPGDKKALHLKITVGKIVIGISVKYTLLDDPDGMYYRFGHRYKAEIDQVVLTSNNKTMIPQKLLNSFTDKTIELTDKEIRAKTIKTMSMYYWFTVKDFNLDEKPDLAFIGDLGYHSTPVNYYVWVNVNDTLVYWNNISDAVSYIRDRKNRIITINSFQNGNVIAKSFKIEKDTFLIPVRVQE